MRAILFTQNMLMARRIERRGDLLKIILKDTFYYEKMAIFTSTYVLVLYFSREKFSGHSKIKPLRGGA